MLSKAWAARHRLVYKTIGGFRIAPSADKHVSRWRALSNRVSTDTINACYTISGKDHIDYVPEEVFEGIIENKLNQHTPPLLSHKSFYNRLFPEMCFVPDCLHKIGGEYYDSKHNPIRQHEMCDIIKEMQYPVVCKKSIDSAGGRDVHFVDSPNKLMAAMLLYDDLVVQPMLAQHSYFRQFHDYGLNTIRVCLYRSVITNKVHLLNSSMRVGKDGHLDNETQGGLVCNINPDGALNHYVVDKYGSKYLSHPNSNIRFSDYPAIPHYEQMGRIAIAMAEKVPYARLISADMALDDKCEWKLIEINLQYQTIRFAQYAGKPFFGEFTDEVIGFCSK